jgi:hypothetical protein
MRHLSAEKGKTLERTAIAVESPFKGTRTKIFQPKHLTRTIVAQNGWFTAHKYIAERQGFVHFEKNRLSASVLAPDRRSGSPTTP